MAETACSVAVAPSRVDGADERSHASVEYRTEVRESVLSREKDGYNPFAAVLSNALTTPSDIREPFYIVDIVPTSSRIQDRDTNLEKVVQNWKFMCTTEHGESLVFMLSRNTQRDTIAEGLQRLLRAGEKSPLFRLVQAKMKQTRGGNDWTWNIELAE